MYYFQVVFTNSILLLNMHFFQPKKLLLRIIVKYLKIAYIVELLFIDFHRFIG